MKDLAYKTMIRPVFEYAATAWDPYLQTLVIALEQVKIRMTHYNDYVSSTHRRVNNDLSWMPLEIRHGYERRYAVQNPAGFVCLC